MVTVRRRLRRWHVWLGWLVGVPMLLWTLSGVVMVAKPIDEVRGTALIRDPAPITSTAGFAAPVIEGRAIASLRLESRASGPRWVIAFADGGSRLADPATGALLPTLGPADAAREVTSRYTGPAKIVETSRVGRASPPLELRRAMDGWRVVLDDGTHFYVDAGSGEIVARRTRWWRFYDFMWGLHIMDLQGREDINNPWIVTFALLSLGMVLLALVILPLTIRRRKRRKPLNPS
ncbi:MAG: PepSY domain-containing protein [Sphingomonas sp.]|uniref:PepSY domain-containing protein n=1 Tax=Sphingomonas sp. TaxID=28214 RepID=UPI0017FA3F5A|nr:PepSY domain-containing protein [Sphingomonas sp.]MBA3666543.1 PepSY domain-containing protein [Sphingomonas sp.]